MNQILTFQRHYNLLRCTCILPTCTKSSTAREETKQKVSKVYCWTIAAECVGDYGSRCLHYFKALFTHLCQGFLSRSGFVFIWKGTRDEAIWVSLKQMLRVTSRFLLTNRHMSPHSQRLDQHYNNVIAVNTARSLPSFSHASRLLQLRPEEGR